MIRGYGPSTDCKQLIGCIPSVPSCSDDTPPNGHVTSSIFLSANPGICNISWFTDAATRAYVGFNSHIFIRPSSWTDSDGYGLAGTECVSTLESFEQFFGQGVPSLLNPGIVDVDLLQFDNTNGYLGPYYVQNWAFKWKGASPADYTPCPIDSSIDPFSTNGIFWTTSLLSGYLVPTGTIGSTFSNGLNLVPLTKDFQAAIYKAIQSPFNFFNKKSIGSILGIHVSQDVYPDLHAALNTMVPYTQFTVQTQGFNSGFSIPINRNPDVSHVATSLANFLMTNGSQVLKLLLEVDPTFPVPFNPDGSPNQNYIDLLNGTYGLGGLNDFCKCSDFISNGLNVTGSLCGSVCECIDPIGAKMFTSCNSSCIRTNFSKCPPKQLVPPSVGLPSVSTCNNDMDCPPGYKCTNGICLQGAP